MAFVYKDMRARFNITIRSTFLSKWYFQRFDKTRLIPLGPQLARAMQEYAAQRTACGASQAHEAPFFVNRDGTPLAARTVSKAFVQLRRAAGVGRENGARNQPRLHDLRHSFAVHRLTAWYRQGADVQRMLPLLSTYLRNLSTTLRHWRLRFTEQSLLLWMWMWQVG